MLFALTGGPSASDPAAVDPCETACPIVEDIEELLNCSPVSGERQLIRHLNNHLREGLIQCGMFEHLAAGSSQSTGPAELDVINQKLSGWCCDIALEAPEKTTLAKSLSRLPRSAWISMPITLWRLRRKLRHT